jgi:hypothetical protein
MTKIRHASKAKIKNLYEVYCKVMRAWAAAVPHEMKHEAPREKLLDAMLRLFEALDATGLRAPLAAEAMDWRVMKPYLGALHDAMRWQLLALDLALPKLAVPFAPTVLTLASLRWLKIWLKGDEARLMAAIDRDLNYLDIAVQQIARVT